MLKDFEDFLVEGLGGGFLKLLKKFFAPTPTLSGTDKRIITYNNAKIEIINVNISEEPKYLVTYPPGLKE